jgi:hypothetical protein
LWFSREQWRLVFLCLVILQLKRPVLYATLLGRCRFGVHLYLFVRRVAFECRAARFPYCFANHRIGLLQVDKFAVEQVMLPEM